MQHTVVCCGIRYYESQSCGQQPDEKEKPYDQSKEFT